MGLLDKLGGAINKTTEVLDKTSKAIGKDLRRRDHEAYLTGMILEKFDVKLLKNLCRYYKIGEPDIEGRIKRSDWIDHAIDEISLESIKDYARKHGISLVDVVKEEERLKKERDEKFKV